MSVADVDKAQPEGELKFRDHVLTYIFAFNFGATVLDSSEKWNQNMLDHMADGLRRGVWKPFDLDVDKLNASGAVKELVERFMKPEEELNFISIQRRWKFVMPPLLITLQPGSSGEPVRAVPVLTIHESGIAHITLFMGNAGQRSAEDLMNFVESFEELSVDVELDDEYKEKLAQIKGALDKACPSDVHQMGGRRLRCSVYFHQGNCLGNLLNTGRGACSLREVFSLLTLMAYHMAYMEYGRGGGIDEGEFLRAMSGAGFIPYVLIHALVDGGDGLNDVFEQVVKRFPRQVFGIVSHKKSGYLTRKSERVANSLVDIYESREGSQFVGGMVSLFIGSSRAWMSGSLVGGIGSSLLGKVAKDADDFGLLIGVRLLLHLYDYELGKVLDEGDASDLFRVERRVAKGMEDVHEVRHQLYSRTSHWWWLAMERLRVDAAYEAVREKLERANFLVVNEDSRQINLSMLALSIMSAIISAILVAEAFLPQQWRAGRRDHRRIPLPYLGQAIINNEPPRRPLGAALMIIAHQWTIILGGGS